MINFVMQEKRVFEPFSLRLTQSNNEQVLKICAQLNLSKNQVIDTLVKMGLSQLTSNPLYKESHG